jgi:hypothetical protein
MFAATGNVAGVDAPGAAAAATADLTGGRVDG